MKLNSTNLQNLAIGYIFLWATAPPLGYGMEYRLLCVVALVIWLLVECKKKSGIVRRPTLPTFLAIFYITYTALIEYMFAGFSGLNRNLQLWIMLLFLIFYESRRYDIQSLLPVFWFALATIPIWQILTLRTLIFEDPHASRILVRSGDKAMQLMSEGVGGYGLVYASLLCLPCLIFLIFSFGKNTSKRTTVGGLQVPRYMRSVILINVVSAVALILYAGYSIAAICLLGLLGLVFTLRKYSLPRVFFASGFLLVCLIVGPSLFERGLQAIAPIAGGTAYQQKVADLSASISSSRAVGTANLRSERYQRSLSLFVESPIIGVLRFDNIGKHSQVLDSFAQFGFIFGGVLLYLLLYLPMRILKRSNTHFGLGVWMIWAILMVFGLNNGFAAAGFMLFIVLPVSAFIGSRASSIRA